MLPDKDIMCHRTGFTKSCRSIINECGCRLWKHIQGKHPQSGAEIDRFDCMDAVQDILMIDLARHMNGVQKAVESRGNDIVKVQLEQIARQERQHREAMSFIPDPEAGALPAGISIRALDAPTDQKNGEGH